MITVFTYGNRLRTGLSLQAPNAPAWVQSYNYDAAKRLTSLSSPAGTFGYEYPASGTRLLISRLSLPSGAAITNAYDSMARLTATHLRNSGGTLLNRHDYTYNAANQRTRLNVMGQLNRCARGW